MLLSLMHFFSAEALKAKKHLYSVVCISIKEQKKRESIPQHPPQLSLQ